MCQPQVATSTPPLKQNRAELSPDFAPFFTFLTTMRSAFLRLHYFPTRRATTGANASTLSSNTEMYEIPYLSRRSCKSSLTWSGVPIRQCGYLYLVVFCTG